MPASAPMRHSSVSNHASGSAAQMRSLSSLSTFMPIGNSRYDAADDSRSNAVMMSSERGSRDGQPILPGFDRGRQCARDVGYSSQY